MIERRAVSLIRVEERLQVLLAEAVKMVAIPLQIRLPLLEKRFAELWHLFSAKEAVGISKTKDHTALDNGFVALS